MSVYSKDLASREGARPRRLGKPQFQYSSSVDLDQKAGFLTKDLGQFASKLLPRKTNQIGRGYHSDVIESKRPEMELCAVVVRVDEVDGDRGRYERPQEVDHQGGRTAGTEADS